MIGRAAIRAFVVAGALAAAAAGPAWAAPANDDFEHATVLEDTPVTLDGAIDGATSQPDDPVQSPGVWYRYQSAVTGPVAVELTDRGVHVAYPPAVYTGATHAGLQQVSRRDDGWYGRSRIDAVAGQWYWIAVTGHEPRGHFTLSVHPMTPPANDDFADARAVRVPRVVSGNLEESTTELGEPSVPPNSGTAWFTIRPRHSGRLTVDTAGSSCAPLVSAFTGSELPALHRIAEAHGVIRFRGVRGRTYRLRLACRGGDTGAYVLDVSDGSIAGKGVHMSVVPGQSVAGVRRHGLRLQVGARRRVGVSIDLLLAKATAHRLRLNTTRIGHLRGKLDYGQDLPATIRLTAAARRALAHRDRLKATLRLTLRDKAPDRVLTVPVRL